MIDLLIKDGYLIDPLDTLEEKGDIYIKDGKINKIDRHINNRNNCKIINAKGYVVAPGLIDICVHFSLEGNQYSQNLEDIIRESALGGFTTIGITTGEDESIDNVHSIRYILSLSEKIGSINVLPIATVTMGKKGEHLSSMYNLYCSGTKMFSDDSIPIINANVMRRALQYNQIMDAVLIVHCEDRNLSQKGVVNEGFKATQLGYPGIPKSAETSMLVRDLLLTEETGGSIHIHHIGNQLSVDYIRIAKERGIKITAGVTPHHIILTEDNISYETPFKLFPPIGSKIDRNSLLSGLQDGIIDIISTDHTPIYNSKEISILNENIPFGATGLRNTLSLLLTEPKIKNVLSMKDIFKKISYNPAKIMKLNSKGRLSVGYDADLVVIDPDRKYINTYNKEDVKVTNDPYFGKEMCGKVINTIVGGKIIVEEGKIVV